MAADASPDRMTVDRPGAPGADGAPEPREGRHRQGGAARIPAAAATAHRGGIAGMLLLFLALFLAGAIPLLLQAAWTTSSLSRAAHEDEAAMSSAIAARAAAGLDTFAMLAGGIVHASDTNLRGAAVATGALAPLLTGAGFRYVALVDRDGRLHACMAATGWACPPALPGLLDSPDLLDLAFAPAEGLIVQPLQGQDGPADLLLLRPSPQAETGAPATIAVLDLAPVAALAAAGASRQSHLVTILDSSGQVLLHHDPALAPETALRVDMPRAVEGEFLDPADNRRHPASLAKVPGLGWTVVVHHRTAGLAASNRIWLQTALLLAAWLIVALVVAIPASRGFTRALARLAEAVSAMRRMAHRHGTAAERDAAGTAEVDAATAAAALHPAQEIRQLATAISATAATLRSRLEDDAAKVRAAEQSNDKKSAFVANISHQLRTPLNSIIGFSEMMTDQIYGPLGHDKYSEYANSVHDSGTYLLRILNDVRDLSRAEIGALDLQESTLDMGRLLRSCISILYREASTRDVQLDLAATDEMPVIRGDEQRLQQALINLITHAVGFSPEGGRVGIAATLTASGEVCVQIQGGGSPINDQELAKLLTPFDEVQRSYDRRLEGAGLGLPLARTLLELHGGRLDIHGLPGQGNVLSAILPTSRVLHHTASPLTEV